MSISADLSWLYAVLLCSIRLGAVLSLSPVLGGFTLPAYVRVLLVMGLSALLVSGLGQGVPVLPPSLGGVVLQVLAELGVGAQLALAVHCAFAVFSMAGRLLDVQIGFGIGGVFDPATRSSSPLLGGILSLVAVVVFFSAGGLHLLIRGIAFSLQHVPLGGYRLFSLEGVVRQFGQVFSLGLQLCAPVVFCLFFVDVGLAVLSRNLPQMNVLVVGMPVKLLVGLGLLALSAVYMAPAFMRVFAAVFSFWHAELVYG